MVHSVAKDEILMTEALQAYLNTNFEKVEGWCIPHLFQTISLCSNVQQDLGLDAPVAEIGVYHGKFFIGLVLGSNSASGHHAIEVFYMQEFNLDGAGKGLAEVGADRLSAIGYEDIAILDGGVSAWEAA